MTHIRKMLFVFTFSSSSSSSPPPRCPASDVIDVVEQDEGDDGEEDKLCNLEKRILKKRTKYEKKSVKGSENLTNNWQ